MTPQEYEYENKLKALDIEFAGRKNALIKECALSNNPHKVGDIITDHIGSIKIEHILTSTRNHKPTCVYVGLELKKDLTPKKSMEKRQVWQINLISK